MRGLLAAGLDRVVGRLVHAVTSTHRSRTDARDLAVWLDRHRGAGIDGLLRRRFYDLAHVAPHL